jgi:hypothetical protein
VIWSVSSLFLAAGQQTLCGGGLMILVGLLMWEQRGFDPVAAMIVTSSAFVGNKAGDNACCAQKVANTEKPTC